MGIANASAALDAGARVLDGSLGGLGGCPFAPGATGNVVFEDLVFLCESKGFPTGIDLERLIAVRAILKSEMPDEPLYGGLARAGLPCGHGGQGGVIPKLYAASSRRSSRAGGRDDSGGTHRDVFDGEEMLGDLDALDQRGRLDDSFYLRIRSGASSSISSGTSGGETVSGNTPNSPATSWSGFCLSAQCRAV